MNESLNGTCWGELPENDWELEIPDFMLSDYKTYSLVVPYSAYQAQGKGRVKRQARAEKKQRRDFINGFVFGIGAFAVIVLAVNVIEIICK